MRLSPREVDRLTLAEFHAMFDGFLQSRGVARDEGPSDDEFARALAEESAAGRLYPITATRH